MIGLRTQLVARKFSFNL